LGVIALLFGLLNLALNLRTTQFVEQDISVVEAILKESLSAFTSAKVADAGSRQELHPDRHPSYKLAGLSCDAYGGPSPDVAQEMVYWRDIPADSNHVSPFQKPAVTEYLTFEPDHGGFNNIRMAMETVLALAFAMGRTLVLPPEKRMYLLDKDSERNHFGFDHFFHMEAIHNEHTGLNIITMQEYLEREAMTGHFRDGDGNVAFPPSNRTQWDGANPDEIDTLFYWLRSVSQVVVWNPEECMAVFPASASHEDTQDLIRINSEVNAENVKWEDYVGKPFPIDASAKNRMKENRAGRQEICLYNETLQAAQRIHFPTDHSMSARLLVHFYAFLFFQDWKQDLWMKRFIRDHVRYMDEIQCAAARVVAAVRQKARAYNNANTEGSFSSFHIRRGDFQYKKTRVEATEIYDMAKRRLAENETVYIATDERNIGFFQPLKGHYNVFFLSDFASELAGVNTNYYGMIDQLVTSRGSIFFGCWFSTFTGYINRIRGYHADQQKLPGYEQGIVNSWYYTLPDRFDHMQSFYPVKQAFYAREFPSSWRLLDDWMEEFHKEVDAKQRKDHTF
jgi:hypothetical protein